MAKVTVEFLRDVVTLAEKSGEMAKKSEVAKEAIPTAVDAMITAGLVKPTTRSTWIEKLGSDPAGVVQTLIKVSEKVRPSPMGSGENKEEKLATVGQGTRPSDEFFARQFSPR